MNVIGNSVTVKLRHGYWFAGIAALRYFTRNHKVFSVPYKIQVIVLQITVFCAVGSLAITGSFIPIRQIFKLHPVTGKIFLMGNFYKGTKVVKPVFSPIDRSNAWWEEAVIPQPGLSVKVEAFQHYLHAVFSGFCVHLNTVVVLIIPDNALHGSLAVCVQSGIPIGNIGRQQGVKHRLLMVSVCYRHRSVVTASHLGRSRKN